MKKNYLTFKKIGQLFTVSALLVGTVPAKAQFTISPSAQASICQGQASATFSVNQINSFPFVETENLAGIVNAAPTPGSPATGAVTYAGIPFIVSSPNTSWDSYIASGMAGNAPQSATVNISCPKSISTLYTLINTNWGETDPNKMMAFLRLGFTDGTSAIVPLDGNLNIRDHRNYGIADNIGSSTNNGFPISTQEVWNNGGSGSSLYRRDMQTIIIPSAYSSKYLNSVTLIDSGSSAGVQRAFISGLSIRATAAAPIVWHAGSPAGPIVPAGPAPTYTISVSPSATTTYYAVTDGGTCTQTATVTVKNCCSDTCFWKVTGNNIIGGNNIFGTLTKDNVQIQTNATNRGIISLDGRLGWGTMTPSTLLHVLCNGLYKMPSDIRFEKLPTGRGRVLVIDDQGYVFASEKLEAKQVPANNDDLSNEVAQLKAELAALKQQLGITNAPGTATDLTIYPNPAKNNLDIRIRSGEIPSGARIVIMDMQGRKLLSNEIKGKEISVNISTLPSGVYIANLVADNKTMTTKKFVVEK